MCPSRASDPPTRVVDIAEALTDLSDILRTPDLDAFLFGSRAYRTGSVRSDIDLLVRMDRRVTREEALRIWELEPYLDVFVLTGGTAASIVNESQITRHDEPSLLAALDAVPVLARGSWVAGADEHRLQTVLAQRNPLATMADLHELDQLPPSRADIVVMTALPEEYRAVAAALRTGLNGPMARAEIKDRAGGSWLVEVVLINTMGSVEASLETLEALRRTKAPHVVSLGIAAGVPGRVELGDIVIPEQIVYYESSKLLGPAKQAAPVWRPTGATVRRRAAVLPKLSGLRGPRPTVNVHTDAVLACGEKVVASKSFRKLLEAHHRKLAAIDMESYGVACAAARRGAELTVVKGVCDFADEEKNDEFHEAAANNAAAQLRVLIELGAFALPDEER
jgi:nucleoside phosphorylase/predicted nucleotidyltransferase